MRVRPREAPRIVRKLYLDSQLATGRGLRNDEEPYTHNSHPVFERLRSMRTAHTDHGKALRTNVKKVIDLPHGKYSPGALV
jgi:hypothetical protein